MIKQMESKMDKVIKLFKPDLSDKKGKIYLGIKIAVALVYTYFLVSFFINKYYIVWTIENNKDVSSFEVARVIIVILLYILGLFMLFVNINLSKKQNLICTIVLSVLSIFIIFYNTQLIERTGCCRK